MSNETKSQSRLSDAIGIVLFILFLPIIIPLLIVALTFAVLANLFLYPAIWLCWCLRGKYVLFVYSNSPIWQEYIEHNILPQLGKKAVVLNWSDRSRWRRTLAVLAFRYFGGRRNFNPLAVVFRPFRRAKKFRFYQPFRDFKHGKKEPLSKLEQGLLDSLAAIGS